MVQENIQPEASNLDEATYVDSAVDSAPSHAEITASGIEEYTADFLLGDKGWVGVAFVIFMVLFIKYAWPKIAGGLDARSSAIAAKLKEAELLKEEAQAILAEAERKVAEADITAARMIETAKADSKQMAINAEKEIEEEIERKISIANEKIKRAELAAVDNVKNKAVDAAIAAASEAIAKELAKGNSAAKSDKLIKESLKAISSKAS